LEAGIKIKLNSVVMRHVNDDEILALYEYAKNKGIEIRFIEFMENESANRSLQTVASHEILATIAKKYALRQEKVIVNSASKPYVDEDEYRFGIIEPYDDSFCKTCNRIRLSAQGDLIPCLYYEDSQNISSVIHSKTLLEQTLQSVVKNKPEKNRWSRNAQEFETSARAFYFTGG
jgi:cyclic pyranopterin phosphate synthase